MSKKNNDRLGRFRGKIVAFRVSEEESKIIDRKVLLSGLTKQDYIMKCLVEENIQMQGNPYVYRNLHNEVVSLAEQLKKGLDINSLDVYELDVLEMTLQMVVNMRHDKVVELRRKGRYINGSDGK